VVEVCVIVSVMSISSTTPAALVTVSSWKSFPAVVIDQVVAESVISPLGVTLVPDHDEYSPPYTSVLMVLVMLVVVVVFDCIEPCVNCGVTV